MLPSKPSTCWWLYIIELVQSWIALEQDKLTEEHYRTIDDALAENDELTTVQLKVLLSHDGMSVSLLTIKKAGRDVGWVISSPKYC